MGRVLNIQYCWSLFLRNCHLRLWSKINLIHFYGLAKASRFWDTDFRSLDLTKRYFIREYNWALLARSWLFIVKNNIYCLTLWFLFDFKQMLDLGNWSTTAIYGIVFNVKADLSWNVSIDLAMVILTTWRAVIRNLDLALLLAIWRHIQQKNIVFLLMDSKIALLLLLALLIYRV